MLDVHGHGPALTGNVKASVTDSGEALAHAAATATPGIFAIPTFAEPLRQVAARYDG